MSESTVLFIFYFFLVFIANTPLAAESCMATCMCNLGGAERKNSLSGSETCTFCIEWKITIKCPDELLVL